ncbi:DoxX family protein [Bradyrhizobium sp. Pear76]|uniref:DoxX family protein n=1 Tax=Bradyrhizobium oropedii TaxID=1571201 RepID=UPI001E5FA570|nr:DoxX family protein [Bradyrhizobium oropedii]MCC8964288.1 DoxX family protein [Bradyrhizobium oropedii]
MNNVLLLLGRILLSVLFIIAGFGKFAMASQMAGMLGKMGVPAPELMVYLMAICEVIGGVAVIIGFQTRIIGILLAVWCIATGLAAHAGDAIELMKNIGLAGGFLTLAATAPRAYAFYGNWPEPKPAKTLQA